MKPLMCLFPFLLLFATTLNARVWVVNQNGTGDFRLIQEAINNSSVLSGDTLFLAPSNHFEQGITNASKSLAFMGAGHDVSIIHASTGPVFQFSGGSQRILGLGLYGGGVDCQSCDSISIVSTIVDVGPIVANSCIRTSIVNSRFNAGDVSMQAFGLATFSLIGSRVQGNIRVTDARVDIEENVIIVAGQGIVVSGSNVDGSTIRNNVIAGSGSAQVAVMVNISGATLAGVSFTNNVLYRSPFSWHIDANNSRVFIFGNLLLSGAGTVVNTGGLTAAGYNCAYANANNALPGPGNVNSDPRLVRYNTADPPDSLDFHFQSNSPCINAGNPDAQYNDLDGSRNDMGVYGGVGPMGSIPIIIQPPAYPAVSALSLFPVIVPGTGTIEIRATGRIGPPQR